MQDCSGSDVKLIKITAVFDCPDDAVRGPIGRNRGTCARKLVGSWGFRYRRSRQQPIAEAEHLKRIADPTDVHVPLRVPLPVSRGGVAIGNIVCARGIHCHVADDIEQLLDDRIVIRGIELPQVVAVHNVDRTVLAATNHDVRVRSGSSAVGQQCEATCCYIEIRRIEVLLVVGSEVVSDRESRGRQLEKGVAEISGAIECTVAGREVEVAGSIGRQAISVHPDASVTLRPVRSG